MKRSILVLLIIYLSLTENVFGEEKLSKKQRLRNAILRRSGYSTQTQTQSAGNGNGLAAPRQEDFSQYGQYPDYTAYENDPNSIALSNKDDPAERVGIIGGKKIVKIIAFSLLGLLAIPLVIAIPLIPIAIVFVVLYNLPLVKLIPFDGNQNDQDGPVAGMRSLINFDDNCIERISCQLGRRSGSYGKSLLYWMQQKFTTNLFVKRVSRGFEHIEDCNTYICSHPLLKRVL